MNITSQNIHKHNRHIGKVQRKKLNNIENDEVKKWKYGMVSREQNAITQYDHGHTEGERERISKSVFLRLENHDEENSIELIEQN